MFLKQGGYSNTFGTNFKPVCGSDGETYSNFAMLKAYTCVDGTKVTKAHDGPCGNEKWNNNFNLKA